MPNGNLSLSSPMTAYKGANNKHQRY